VTIQDHSRAIKPRARYAGEEVYFADLEEFGADGVREILIECGVPSSRAGALAWWLVDQARLTRHVSAQQGVDNRKKLLEIRAKFVATRDSMRDRLIPR
jgi:hypothetical protein